MDLEEAADISGFSTDWLQEAISRRLIRAQPERARTDVPTDEVMFLRRASRWLPHLLDTLVSEEVGSAVLFGREAVPRNPWARDLIVLTTVDDPERALDLNAILSTAARREIYVVTWSSGISHPAFLRDAVTKGRILRDEGATWRRFVESELPEERISEWSPTERERLTSLLRQWASADAAD